jgi:hypothetical protein
LNPNRGGRPPNRRSITSPDQPPGPSVVLLKRVLSRFEPAERIPGGGSPSGREEIGQDHPPLPLGSAVVRHWVPDPGRGYGLGRGPGEAGLGVDGRVVIPTPTPVISSVLQQFLKWHATEDRYERGHQSRSLRPSWSSAQFLKAAGTSDQPRSSSKRHRRSSRLRRGHRSTSAGCSTLRQSSAKPSIIRSASR